VQRQRERLAAAVTLFLEKKFSGGIPSIERGSDSFRDSKTARDSGTGNLV